MEINITDEQIKEIASKQIQNILKPKIDTILKESYFNGRSFRELIERQVEISVNEKVSSLLTNEKLMGIIKKQDLAKQLSDIIVGAVSRNIIDEIYESAEN